MGASRATTENRTSRGRERLRSDQEDPVRVVSIVEFANQASPVVFLLFENPTSTPSSAGIAMSRLLGARSGITSAPSVRPSRGKIRPDGLGDVVRRQMGVVLLG